MRIALDARELTSPEPRGGGRYLLGLLTALLARDDDVEYCLLSWSDLGHDLGDPRVQVVVDPGPRGARFRVWDQWTLPKLVRRTSPTILHCPVNLAPLRQRCPTIVTVHDTVMLHERGEATLTEFLYLRRFLPPALRRAHAILTVSEFSAADIAREVGISSKRIIVTYPGVDRDPDSRSVSALPPEIGIEPGYVFHLGATDPRKNTSELLESYSELIGDHPEAPPLVVAGLQPEGQVALKRRAEELGVPTRVRILGYVSDETLRALYDNARVFCYPSRWEGFGFPALEAMRAGCPVIAADSTSIPEVVGDAALLVAPNDREAWARAIARALASESLRIELRERGFRRVEAFRWDRSAERTFAVYQQIAGDGRPLSRIETSGSADTPTRRSARLPNA